MPDDPRCHTLSWFEIPLRDLARVDALYGATTDPASGAPPDAPTCTARRPAPWPDAPDAFARATIGDGRCAIRRAPV